MSAKTRIISALWFWSVVNYLDRVGMSVAGPTIMKSMALPPSAFGVILSSFGLGYLLAQLPGGLIADKWGGKIVLVVGPLFWAMFTGLTGLVTTLAGFVIVRALFGVSEGLSVTSLHRIVGDRFEPKDRARAIGISLSALAVAPALAGPFVGVLMLACGWRAMFALLMIPAVLAALINYIAIPSAPPAAAIDHHQSVEDDGSLGDILRRPTFWLMSAFYFGYNIAFWGYIGWMPSYLAMARHISLTSLGALAGIPYLLALLGLLLGGWLGAGALHRRRPQLIAGSLLLGGASLFLAYRADGLVRSLIGLSSTAFFLYGCQGAIGAVILDLAPVRARATYAGCISTAGQVGGLVAPAIVGVLVSKTGTFASGFDFMAASLCLSAGCMLVLIGPISRKIERREIAMKAMGANTPLPSTPSIINW